MNELPDKKEPRTDFEISQIEKELEIIGILKSIMKNSELDKIQIRAAAGSLHSIYNGIEKILLLKIKDLTMQLMIINHNYQLKLGFTLPIVPSPFSPRMEYLDKIYHILLVLWSILKRIVFVTKR